MSFEGHLLKLTRDTTEITNIVGREIFPLFVPEKRARKGKAIIITIVSQQRDHALLGPTGFVEARVQFDIWAVKWSDTVMMSREVRLLWDGYKGVVDTTEITCSMLSQEGEDFSREPGQEQLDRYRKMLEFRMWFNESTVKE